MPVTIGGSGPITGVTSINTTVSDTELGYLDGVTSALQTQINAKANDSSQGLYLITPTSIANSGGSASASGGAVTFSGVTTVSINGVFTSTYDNYRIVANVTASTGVSFIFRLRVSGSDNSTSNYRFARSYTQYSSTGDGTSRTSTGTSWQPGGLGTDAGIFGIDVCNPQAAKRTAYASLGSAFDYREVSAGVFNADTQFDGFTILQDGAATLSGIVRVYGYKN